MPKEKQGLPCFFQKSTACFELQSVFRNFFFLIWSDGWSSYTIIISGDSVNLLKVDIVDFIHWNFQISSEDTSYQLFSIFILFFLDIENSYILTSCIGFQLDVSTSQRSNFLEQEVNVFIVFFYLCRSFLLAFLQTLNFFLVRLQRLFLIVYFISQLAYFIVQQCNFSRRS